MRSVRETYEDYRQAAGMTRVLKHFDDLSDAERQAFTHVALSVAKEGIDGFVRELEHQCDLAMDRKLAKLAADPKLKLSERRRA